MGQNNNMNIVGDYPPPDHMLRDLGVSLRFEGEKRSQIRVPVVPEITTDKGGVQAGVLATLVDILGGALAVTVIYPDWIATADLSLHTTDRAVSGVVSASGSVLREGRTTVVIEVDIHEEENDSARQKKQIGASLITFSRLPHRGDTPELEISGDAVEASEFVMQGPGLARPYLEKAGVRVLDEASGDVMLPLNDYVRNSFGSLQGGMVALLADVAGQHAARKATGRSLTTSDLEIHFLSQGKVGPFRTRAKVLRTTPQTALTRVEVMDTGAGNRLITVAMNTATL